MANNSRRAARGTPNDGPAHFVPLAVIIDDYAANLFGYMRGNNADDVVVTMSVTVDVTNHGKKKFFVAVAVTTRFDGPEALSDEIERTAPKGHTRLFAWVPANLYNSKEFGIFIDEAPIGEVLKNGLVNEVIEQAAVEKTVISLNR
jgi:formaldehyde-activating enzyme involved in methanogenesis